jgi:hypothetical protein
MTTEIKVLDMDPHDYAVEIHEGYEVTHHKVKVPEDFAVDVGVPGVDEKRLVREAIDFLLEREPATAIRKQFSLDEIRGYFPEFPEELARRLS